MRASTRLPNGSRRWHAPRSRTPADSRRGSKPSADGMKLTLGDIADLRAYERERDEFRQQVIALKKLRRVAIGPFVSIVFENSDTVRFQIQEMARVEKILSDDAIQAELDIYNPLIPDAGSLAATMFIELTSKDELVEWLPKLVGVERAVELHIGDGEREVVVGARVDPDH